MHAQLNPVAMLHFNGSLSFTDMTGLDPFLPSGHMLSNASYSQRVNASNSCKSEFYGDD